MIDKKSIIIVLLLVVIVALFAQGQYQKYQAGKEAERNQELQAVYIQGVNDGKNQALQGDGQYQQGVNDGRLEEQRQALTQLQQQGYYQIVINANGQQQAIRLGLVQ